MSFINRNFVNLFLLMLVLGLVLGAGLAYTNKDVPYLSVLKPTATPTPAAVRAVTAPQGGSGGAPITGGQGPVVVAPGSSPTASLPMTATAGQGQNPGANPAGGRGFAGRGTTGTVESISGKTITIKAQDGSTARATVTDNTVYQKMTTITAAEIKVGDTILATGQVGSDGTLAAQTIQVGGLAGAGPAAGAQALGGGRQGGSVNIVSGTVQKIDGATLTVAIEGGQTAKVALGSDTRMNKIASATLSDIKVGDQVTIAGQAGADGVITATSVQVGASR